jgi:transposase
VLLFDKGWSIAEIAEAFLLSHDAIHEHVTEYKDSKKLKPENGGSIYLETSRIRLHFLPPYSPNLNPSNVCGSG